MRGQAATFVTSCRRPRRGSEAVAAAKAHEVLSTYRDSLVLTSESDCAAARCRTCSATSLLLKVASLYIEGGYQLAAEGSPPVHLVWRSVRC